ncbi:52 kDa repressor of the inhibitor of the protein kinase-like [Mixophyes fleayi]|uniref:52 kDa repressor of the inhibitor of the protein kinase-like n=1 Tax=Mixophyes fleayi TaxID=3061075 RepID=UPI003F4DED00
MKRSQQTMDLFIAKKRVEDKDLFKVEKDSELSVEYPEDCFQACDSMQKNDIGNYIESISTIDDHLKCELLERPWKPSLGFKLPFSTHNKKGKQEKRFLNQSHLDSFPWLIYSDAKKGVFCKYCALFFTATMGGSHKHVTLQKLVKKPLTVFAKLLGKDGDLCTHEKRQYHRNSVQAAKDFLNTHCAPERNVMNRISSQRLQQIQENRQRLKPIVETILFLGRQNIPLRGHRDDGELCKEADTEPLMNEGNFRELLQFKDNSGGTALANHLENTHSNAAYISENTQNQLTECCAEEIRRVILERVKESKYYCVIFDETTDISHSSQLSLCLSYVYKNQRHEDFIAFENVHESCFKDSSPSFEPKVSGKVLGQLVIRQIKKLNLDLMNCVGIGTDGCSLMISEQLGAVAEIQKEAKYATRCPCFNDTINLSMSKTSKVQSIRNCIGIIKEVAHFFNASPQRNHVLLNVVNAQLKDMCETHWVERSECLIQFLDQIEKIVEALEYISQWTEPASSFKAQALLSALQNIEFVVALHCQLAIFTLCLPLSRLFQKKTVDLTGAAALVTDLLSVLNKQRVNCNEEFSSIFSKASQVLSKPDVAIELPRITKKNQMHRANIPVSTPEDYYRQAIYIPLLDSVTCDLQSRFSVETLSSCDLTCLLPRNILLLNNEALTLKVKTFCSTYGNLISTNPSLEWALLSEVHLWKEKWIQSGDSITLPESVEEALQACDEDVYLLVNSFLKILLTLPISVSSDERSFSSRRLKMWLRNQMGQERLTGLALLHIHREIKVDLDRVIDRFANSGN